MVQETFEQPGTRVVTMFLVASGLSWRHVSNLALASAGQEYGGWLA